MVFKDRMQRLHHWPHYLLHLFPALSLVYPILQSWFPLDPIYWGLGFDLLTFGSLGQPLLYLFCMRHRLPDLDPKILRLLQGEWQVPIGISKSICDSHSMVYGFSRKANELTTTFLKGVCQDQISHLPTFLKVSSYTRC